MIVDKDGNTLSSEKETHIRKSLKQIFQNHIPLATAEQVNLVSDLVESSIMGHVSQAYREGFHNGGASNGGMNRHSKMVLQFMRATEVSAMFSPVGIHAETMKKYIALLDEELLALEDIPGLDEEIAPGCALRILAKMVHIQMRLAWEMGIADILSEAFEEVHGAFMSVSDEQGKIKLNSEWKIIKDDRYKEPKISDLIEKKRMVIEKIKKDRDALKKFENEDHYKRPLTVEDIMDRPKEEHVEEERKETPAH